MTPVNICSCTLSASDERKHLLFQGISQSFPVFSLLNKKEVYKYETSANILFKYINNNIHNVI